MKFKKKAGLAAVIGASLLCGSVMAGPISNNLASGERNTLEDQDREAFIDNGDGRLGIGDVFIGYVGIDNMDPAGVNTTQQIYGVISNQITAVYDLQGNPDPNGYIFSLGTTTVNGLRLEDLTGDANAAGGMFAVYDNAAFSEDFVASPSGPGMKDVIDSIVTEGSLELVLGFNSPDNYLTVTNTSLPAPGFPGGTPTSVLATVPNSITTGNFVGGLDVLYNTTGFLFADTVATLDPLTGAQNTQIGIRGGTVNGAVGDSNAPVFTDASGYGFNQCIDPNDPNAFVACGFITDADFLADPFKVPEPTALTLLGTGLLGVAGLRRRRKSA